MREWHIYKPWRHRSVDSPIRNGELRYIYGDVEFYRIDRVYYNDDCDAQYVRDTLIGHDGYDNDILVVSAEVAGPESAILEQFENGGVVHNHRKGRY